jgi:MFS family permease
VAAPFLAVFLLQQMQFSLSTVPTLWVTSQVANAVVLYIWGRLSDRLSNKAILRVALPLYFVCMLGLAFAAIPMRAASRSPCCTSCTSPWVPPPAAAVSRRAT